jgi:hypothetical protein
MVAPPYFPAFTSAGFKCECARIGPHDVIIMIMIIMRAALPTP